MIRCDDRATLLAFCERDPIRYRHIIHELASPCPEWDTAMRSFYGSSAQSSAFFVDSLADSSLIAHLRGRELRLEGQAKGAAAGDLASWCRGLSPGLITTTHKPIRSCLAQIIGEHEWALARQYTAHAGSFRPKVGQTVRMLRPEDRPTWERFVARHADEPMVVPGKGGSGAGVRDFEFMCSGMPVACYAAEEGGELIGFISVNPMTRGCDEVSAMYVSPDHRRRGVGSALLSAGTRDILARERLPGYFAGEAGGDVDAMLRGVGYELVSSVWTVRL